MRAFPPGCTYRRPGAPQWQVVPMKRRVKAVFAVEIPAKQITAAGLEYYVEADDGDNVAIYPNAPLQLTNWTQTPLSLVGLSGPAARPGHARRLPRRGRRNRLVVPRGRGLLVSHLSQPAGRLPARAGHFLTYVANGTTRFRDASEDFAGRKRRGPGITASRP